MHWSELIAELGDIDDKCHQLLTILIDQPDTNFNSDYIIAALHLAPKSGDRQVRAMVTKLCELGVPIIGSPEGIQLCTDPNQIMAYADRREAEIRRAHHTATDRITTLRRVALQLSGLISSNSKPVKTEPAGKEYPMPDWLTA